MKLNKALMIGTAVLGMAVAGCKPDYRADLETKIEKEQHITESKEPVKLNLNFEDSTHASAVVYRTHYDSNEEPISIYHYFYKFEKKQWNLIGERPESDYGKYLLFNENENARNWLEKHYGYKKRLENYLNEKIKDEKTEKFESGFASITFTSDSLKAKVKMYDLYSDEFNDFEHAIKTEQIYRLQEGKWNFLNSKFKKRYDSIFSVGWNFFLDLITEGNEPWKTIKKS